MLDFERERREREAEDARSHRRVAGFLFRVWLAIVVLSFI